MLRAVIAPERTVRELAMAVLRLQIVVLGALLAMQIHKQSAEQAAQESSSSNTQHHFNPYSHSKVLASGLHLLA